MYLYIFFRNPLNLCKAHTKVFAGILEKEQCGVSVFMGKSWRVNSWKIKCGDVQICEIPTSGLQMYFGMGWGRLLNVLGLSVKGLALHDDKGEIKSSPLPHSKSV